MSQERSTETLTDERLIQLNQPQPRGLALGCRSRIRAEAHATPRRPGPERPPGLGASSRPRIDPVPPPNPHALPSPLDALLRRCSPRFLTASRRNGAPAIAEGLTNPRGPFPLGPGGISTPPDSRRWIPKSCYDSRDSPAAYHADDLTTLGQHGEAADAIFDAQTKLRGIQCAEERATLLQIDALRRRDESKGRPSMAQLEHAAELLRTTPVPGRWSELQLVRGRLFLYWKRADLAITPLGMALERLPSGLAHHLWVDTYLALAAAKISLLRFDEAARHLDEAAPFFTNEILHEDLQAQLQLDARPHRPENPGQHGDRRAQPPSVCDHLP